MIDLERIEQRLRDEPAAPPGRERHDLATMIAARRAAIPGSVSFTATTTRRLGDGAIEVRPGPRVRGLGRLALVGALVAAASTVLFQVGVPGGAPRPTASPTASPAPSKPPDALARIRAAGVLRIAVEGPADGFDAGVATKLASALGVRPQIVTRSATGAPVGDDADIVVGMVQTGGAEETLAFSGPYAYRPIRVAVPAGSTARSVADLAGTRLCVIAHGESDQWLVGYNEVISPLGRMDPPTGIIRSQQPTAAACLTALANGEADAFVDDGWTARTLSDPRIRVLDDVIEVEQFAVGVRRTGPDATRLLSEIDRMILDLRADGTLASLSRSHLDGLDLTAVPTR